MTAAVEVTREDREAAWESGVLAAPWRSSEARERWFATGASYHTTRYEDINALAQAFAARAARAVEEALRGERWRPIETAPRDGTGILVWLVPRADLGAPCAVITRWEAATSQWFACGWWGECTRWQPLPAAPATKEG